MADTEGGVECRSCTMAMLKHLISTLALLASAVWLGFPMLGSSSHSPTGATYDVVAQSSEQGRSFVIRDTTIDPGGSIGWHWHQGTVIALVKQGTLYHLRSDCTVDAIYRAGDSFIEPRGPEHVHDGRNYGTTPVVLEIMYVVLAGSPLAQAPNLPIACP
ncbi:cupin domain-containing protein [Mycobacterium kubicae]|uniref:cupin domain-containing protein n=1 Tax=Mycobacterium kubicae TaxID=120959 RepID=UPI000A8E20A6|nr:cupin domain-containing protein [Mycobacterium kubicae]